MTTCEIKQMDCRIGPDMIRAQVNRIMSSDGFARCRRMQRFLEFIVEESLAGRADQLSEYAIGTEVFDRGYDFEPALDPIVRNDARRLRLKLLEYYRLSSPDNVVIEIPKGGYAPRFHRSSAPEHNVPVSRRRIAVLPFEVLAEGRAQAMYGRSLCISLTAGLANLGSVEAVAHSYFGEQNIRDAAAELRLSHAIHGSVSQGNGSWRVVVNLIHVTDGTLLWADEYQLNGSDIAVRSEIVSSVLREVAARLSTKTEAKSMAMAA